MKRVAFAVLVSTLAGCASFYPPPPPPPAPPEHPANEFFWSTGHGSNAVVGDAAWRRDGRHFTCAGQSAALMPDTPFTERRVNILYGSNQRALRTAAQVKAKSAAEPGGDIVAPYVRTTKCDAQGKFAFRDLPDGGWFLIVRAQSGQTPAVSDQALVIMQRVEARGGTTRTLSLPGA